MKRRTALFTPGTPVFNLFSLSVGTFEEVWTPPTRLSDYTTSLAVVEVVGRRNRITRVRWRLDNCRRYTPRRLRARQAFLVLCRTIGISPQRMRTRARLTRYGFTRSRRKQLVEQLRRRCRITLAARTIPLTTTANQVVALVLAAQASAR